MRFFSPALISVAAWISVQAAPSGISRRAVGASDIAVLKFADVLEQLESQFYKDALAKFKDQDFVAAGFPTGQVPVEQFQIIQSDEATHSSVLQATLRALKEEPITTCKFKFDSVLKDVATMAATARVVEMVGVGAYLGAAPLVKDPVLLTAAGSILTVEARHQTILNLLSQNGTAIPSAFDIALTPPEVLALASSFIDGPCDLGVPANPPLAITNTGTVVPGTKLTFSSATLNSTNQGKAFCQMLIGGQPTSIALPLNECVVPKDINGPVVIWLTSDSQALLNNVRDRATSQLIAGPTIAFIDTQPQLLGQLVRFSVNNPTPVSSSSTITLKPAEASSVISAASSTSTSVSVSIPSPSPALSEGFSTAPGPNASVGKSPDAPIIIKMLAA